jgi:HlyD family secretion protein
MMNLKTLLCFLCLLLPACSKEKSSVALGTLERDRVAHTATVNEIITSLPVSSGSFVKQGTVLVQLDDTLQKALVAKANAELQQARANLDKVRNGAREEEVAAAKAEVSGAQATLIKSEANYQRAKVLIQKELASQATLDTSLAARDESLARLNSAKEKLSQLTNGARIEDLAIAEAIYQTNIAQLASEQKKLDDLTITAKRDGIVDNLPWNLGERVTAGSPVAIVLAGKTPFARVYIPEPYRVSIRIGDSLNVKVDGITALIKGKVRWIATEPAFTPYYALNQEERSRLMYLAEIVLPESAASLPIGIPAQVLLSKSNTFND